MRGPFWNNTTGVTGEPNFDRDKTENYETYVDDQGVTRTRILDSAEKSSS